MPEKPTGVPADIGFALDDLVRRVAHAMDPQNAFADHGDAREAAPAQCRADDLARLRAIEALHSELTVSAHMLAHRAGGRTEAPVTYAELGDAVGITRQAARERWPGAVPDARPGRPRKQVNVLFTGGPAAWDGYTMQYPASTLEGELESIGAYLVVDGDQVPEDVPANARAHYAPADGGLRHIWEFKGWVPA